MPQEKIGLHLINAAAAILGQFQRTPHTDARDVDKGVLSEVITKYFNANTYWYIENRLTYWLLRRVHWKLDKKHIDKSSYLFLFHTESRTLDSDAPSRCAQP